MAGGVSGVKRCERVKAGKSTGVARTAGFRLEDLTVVCSGRSGCKGEERGRILRELGQDREGKM